MKRSDSYAGMAPPPIATTTPPTSAPHPMRPGKRPYSLSWRLLGVTALVLILAGAGVVGAIAAVQNFMPELVLEHRLESNAKRVIDALQYDQQDRPYQVTLSERRQMLYQVLPKDSAYRLLDGEGRVLLASDGAVTAYTRAGRDFDPTARLLNLQPDGMKVAVLTLPFSHRGQPMFMQLMRSDRLHRFTLTDDAERVRDLTLIASLVGMLLFSLVVVATLHYLLKPLRRTSAAIASIQPENLSARLSLDLVPLELTPLFDGFNLALDRLETGYRQQRQFLADVAHELKTPLALMRGQVELGQLGDRSMLLKDIDQMARHVHQLLHLAEASEQHNYLVEALDPGEVLAQVCEQLERLARSREVRVVFIASDAAGPELVNADAGALSVLLKNLLENALHHSPPGSTVNVCADGAGISIRDHGPGIAPEAMPHLFERFWRGPHRRDEGAGLGLSICAEIVRAHGWALHVTSTDPGAQFDVRFNAP